MESSLLGAVRMKQTVYVDVLVAVNFLINYFLLLAARRFLGVPAKRSRLVAAAALGAFFSLSILLPEVPAAFGLLVKLFMSVCIVLAAFGYGGIRRLLRATAAFYIISFGFAGLMMALWYFIAPQGLIVRNTVVYFNISPLMLILLAVLCYFVITLVNRVTGRQAPKGLYCRIVFSYGGAVCDCVAKVDTGNSLREPFSNDPVVVVCEQAAAKTVPPEGSLNFRMVPFRDVSGGGLLRAFRPERLTVYQDGRAFAVTDVYIAVSRERPGDCDALINPDILQQASG